jgi:hypothetical protein
MAIDKARVQEEMKFLDEMMSDLAKNHKETHEKITRKIQDRSAKYLDKIVDRLKLEGRGEEGVEIAERIGSRFVDSGKLKNITIDAMREHLQDVGMQQLSEQQIDQVVDLIEKEHQQTAQPAQQTVSQSTQASTSAPAPTPTTQTGLPKQDPATPKAKKVPRAKKKVSFGQKLKKWGRAAVRMSPIFGQYLDNLDEEESRAKQQARREKQENDPNANITGTSIGNAEVLKLLEKIEQNTRGMGESGEDSPNKPKKSSSLREMLSKGVRSMLGGTDAGRFMVKSYDKTKSALGSMKDMGSSVKQSWADKSSVFGLGDWAKKQINRADNSLQHGAFGQQYLGAQWAAKEKFRDAKNLFKSKTSDIGERISNLNPFKSKSEKSVEETREEENKKNSIPATLKAIETNTKATAKSGGGGLMKMLSGLFLPIKAVFGKLLLLLAPLGVVLLKVAAAFAAFKLGGIVGDAVKSGADSLTQAITGDKDDTLGTGIYKGVDKVAGLFGKSDADKEAAMEKQSVISLYEQKKKSGDKISADLAKKLTSYGVEVDQSMVISKASPSPSLRLVPEAIEKSAAKKEQIENEIDKNNTSQAMAPIIAAPITTVNKNQTSTSIRLHPRNQESTWMRYNEGRYAQ